MPSVVIADDDPDICDLVRFKLERTGFTVVATADGRAALAAVKEHAPDLVVLDVMMPGLTGIEVCRELRLDAGTRATPVILLTARAQEADVERGFEAGADDYIVKPFSPRELLSRVHAVMARGRLAS